MKFHIIFRAPIQSNLVLLFRSLLDTIMQQIYLRTLLETTLSLDVMDSKLLNSGNSRITYEIKKGYQVHQYANTFRANSNWNNMLGTLDNDPNDMRDLHTWSKKIYSENTSVLDWSWWICPVSFFFYLLLSS